MQIQTKFEGKWQKYRYNLDWESIIWLLKIIQSKNHPHYNNGLFILHNLFAITDPLLKLISTRNKSMQKKEELCGWSVMIRMGAYMYYETIYAFITNLLVSDFYYWNWKLHIVYYSKETIIIEFLMRVSMELCSWYFHYRTRIPCIHYDQVTMKWWATAVTGHVPTSA